MRYTRYAVDTYIFMLKSGKDFDFPQSPLTIGLMFKWGNLLYGNFGICEDIIRRS